jgi:hypothetical protein
VRQVPPELELGALPIEKLEPGRIVDSCAHANDSLTGQPEVRKVGEPREQPPIIVVARRERVGFSQEPVNPGTLNQRDRGLVAVIVCERDGGIGDTVNPGNSDVDVNQPHPLETVEVPHRGPPHQADKGISACVLHRNLPVCSTQKGLFAPHNV